jgi:hypothetical protein
VPIIDHMAQFDLTVNAVGGAHIVSNTTNMHVPTLKPPGTQSKASAITLMGDIGQAAIIANSETFYIEIDGKKYTTETPPPKIINTGFEWSLTLPKNTIKTTGNYIVTVKRGDNIITDTLKVT